LVGVAVWLGWSRYRAVAVEPVPAEEDGTPFAPLAHLTAALALFAAAAVPALSGAHHVCRGEQLVVVQGRPAQILAGAVTGVGLAFVALVFSALAWERGRRRTALAVGLSLAALAVAAAMALVWIFYFTDSDPCAPFSFP
jgi:hypothetical protein